MLSVRRVDLDLHQENTNILRDAAQLQAQLRLYDALVETRHLLLKIRPTLRQHWIGLAVAHHLNGNLPEARKVLDHYHRIVKVRVCGYIIIYNRD
jgi:hypothetical protein